MEEGSVLVSGQHVRGVCAVKEGLSRQPGKSLGTIGISGESTREWKPAVLLAAVHVVI